MAIVTRANLQSGVNVGFNVPFNEPFGPPPYSLNLSQMFNPMASALPANPNPSPPPQPYPTIFSSPGALEQEFNCDSTVIFEHTGGEMNWVFAIGLTGGAPQNDGINIEPYLNGLAVGNAGVPTFNLEQIIPSITVSAASIIYEAASTPNGTKNVQLTIALKNPNNYQFNNVSIAQTGMITQEDPNSYPNDPIVVSLVALGVTNYQKEFEMSNSVGTVQLTLTDGINQYTPLTVNFTPLFTGLTAALDGHPGVINGKTVQVLDMSLGNTGNSTTVAAVITISATVNGQPIQISGRDENDNEPPYGSTFTYSPYFNESDPVVNPSGDGLGWNPGQQVSGILVFIPLTAQAQEVVLTAGVTDGPNVFPPSQVTIQVPAA
jgi:hypothetical protein